MPSLGQFGGALTGGGVIGGAVVRLVLDDAQFTAGLAKADAQLKATSSSAATSTTRATTGIGAAFSRMSGAAQIALVAAGAALVKFTADSVTAFQEAQQVTAQTEAVLKSTGATAGVTASQVGDLASSIRDYSGIDDEAVQASENLLLTFRAVQNQAGAGNDIFNQATGAIADMATALNSGAVPSMEDLHAATLQLGKALNDPVVGLTALRRVGVSFTASQADLIKSLAQSGHLLEAQKLILSEVEKEFGGAAKAAGDTFGGAISKLSSHFRDLQEAIGQGITPLITAFAKGLSALLPLLVPVARNLYLIIGAAAGFAALRFLPELLLGIAGAMETLGATGAANGIAGLAAGLSALTAPEIIGALGILYSTIGLIQRVTGHKPLIDPAVTADIAQKIGGLAESVGLIPTPLEQAAQAAQTFQSQLQKAQPVLQQMGVSMQDFAGQAVQAAQKGQTAFQDFSDKALAGAASAIQKWRQTTADSLNFVDDALGNFAGKTHVAASQIINAFQQAANAQKQFGSDIQTILKRGGADAQGLAQQLISMGKDGVAAAHAIASAHQKAFQSIVSGYAKGAAAANKLSGTLQGQIVGTLNDIKGILEAIARTWGVKINVNDGQANSAIAGVQSHLNALQNKTVTVTVITNTQSYKTFPGGGHAAGGVITRGAAYDVIGEGSYSTAFGRGAEAVLPLNDTTLARLAKQMHKVGGGVRGVPNINLTINTQGAMDPDQLAASVSRHLSRTIREEALV